MVFNKPGEAFHLLPELDHRHLTLLLRLLDLLLGQRVVASLSLRCRQDGLTENGLDFDFSCLPVCRRDRIQPSDY